MLESLPAEQQPIAQQLLRGGIPAVRTALHFERERAREAGGRIGFGTDLMGGLDGEQLHGLRLQAEVEGPLALLRAATSVNAELLGRDDLSRIGRSRSARCGTQRRGRRSCARAVTRTAMRDRRCRASFAERRCSCSSASRSSASASRYSFTNIGCMTSSLRLSRWTTGARARLRSRGEAVLLSRARLFCGNTRSMLRLRIGPGLIAAVHGTRPWVTGGHRMASGWASDS